MARGIVGSFKCWLKIGLHQLHSKAVQKLAIPCMRNHDEPDRNGALNLIKVVARAMDLVGRYACELEIGILYQLDLEVGQH